MHCKLMSWVLTGTTLLFSGGALSNEYTTGHLQQLANFNEASVTTFFDELIPQQLDKHNLPGATISVVKDDQVVFLKGYGLADIEKNKPVDPSNSLFRVGSVTKLFVGTAIMQLADQGKIDLDADINNYLISFQIPDSGYAPITVAHLMTHSAGFEDIWSNGVGDSRKGLSPAKWLAAGLPQRIREPGSLAAYSNYSFGLLGHIVETVSAMPFGGYVEENILKVLGMRQSTMQDPLPEHLIDDVTIAYGYEDGVQIPKEMAVETEEGVQFASGSAAGGLVSSAGAMAKFMIAQINGGCYQEACILSTETTEKMHQRIYGRDPRMPGMASTFHEVIKNGQRFLAQSGRTIYFNSNLMINTDAGVGFFISTNGGGGSSVWQEVTDTFVDHFFPVGTQPEQLPVEGFAERAKKYEGEYRYNRRSYTTLEKILSTAFGDVVSVTERNTLLLQSKTEPTKEYYELEPGLFKWKEGDERIAFGEDEEGRVYELYFSIYPTMSGERVAWYETLTIHFTIVIIAGIFFVTTMLAVLLSRKRLKVMPAGVRRPLNWAAVSSALFLVFYAGFYWVFAGFAGWIVNQSGSSLEHIFGAALSPMVPYLLVFPVLGGLCTVPVVYYAFSAWRNSTWSGALKTYYSLFALITVIFLWSLNLWNFLGWNY